MGPNVAVRRDGVAARQTMTLSITVIAVAYPAGTGELADAR